MAGGSSSLSAVNFPDPREVKFEVGESSRSRKTRPPRPRARPPLPSSRVNLSLDMAVMYELKHGNLDPNMDTKKLRRIVSNRLAAQRSRQRRSCHVIDLEAKTDGLEDFVKNLTPEVEALQRNKQMLEEESDSLRAASNVRSDELKIAERVTEELQAEIMRLRENLGNLDMNKQTTQEIDDDEEDQQDDEVYKYLNLDGDENEMMNLDV